MNPLFLVDTPDDDLEIEPDHFSPEREVDPDELDELQIEPDPGDHVADVLLATPLAQILPADFKLPALIKFVPNGALRIAADAAADYALTIPVEGAAGLQRADLALTAVRSSLKAIETHLEEPIAITNALHKRLTTVRSEWMAHGKTVVADVSQRIYTEQRRLELLALDERRKAQADADARERAAAQREVEAATAAQAPAPVVAELKRQAQTATAPPVQGPSIALPLRGSSTVTTWKCRLTGTPGSDNPNPDMAVLTPAQRHQAFELLKAIVDGKAPLAAVAIDWSYLNKRAKADKSTLAIPGLEAFEEGSLRAKGQR